MDPIHIQDVDLADDETWNLKMSLHNNYWACQKKWSKNHKGIDPDAQVVDDVAHKLLHESIDEIGDEIVAVSGPD